jgi:ADP-ribosylglycohydrolase
MGAATPPNPTPLRNSYWVVPGKVLAGEHPGGTTVEATRERLERLLAAGVDCFIDLTEPGELKPYDVELPLSIEYLRKPIRDHGIPAQRLHMAEILDCLHDALQSGRCVYVHCRAGIGRTGMVIGCLLVERGLAGDVALDELNRLWQYSERSQSWGSVPETDEQVGFVRKWKARGLFAVGEFAAGAAPVLGSGPVLGTGPAVGMAPAVDTASVVGTGPVPRAGPVLAGAPIRGGAVTNAPVGSELAHNLGVTASNLAIDDDPLLDPAALSAAQTLRDRFHGALIGLAVGDAVAAATQFRRPGTFTPVGDMLGGGPFDLPRGAWSDDTSMALCLADSLLECNEFDARDQMERYRRWQQEGYLAATGQCVGITASTARAIAIAQWRRQAFFGSHDPSQVDPEPLSRVAPAVLFFFATSGPAVDQATEAARTTCQSPVVLEACRGLASALYAALSGQPKAVVLERATMAAVNAAGAVTGNGARSGVGAAAAIAGVEAGAGGGLSGGGAAAHHSPGASAGTGGGAPAVLAAAVAAFGATGNFRDAILYAANLGGDSDVIAAVCGQLAGAYYSVKAIPTSWHNGLMHKELIADCADRLLAHAMLGLSG